MDLAEMTSSEVRERIRRGEITRPTAGMARRYAQANLVILPKNMALDFLIFCQRNPKPCPVLDVTEPGSAVPSVVAAQADLRTDVPKYRVYRRGELVDEPSDILSLWQNDLVAFLLGCSFTFEEALLKNGIEVRHIARNSNVPMYRTNIPTVAAGDFSGHLVVSMRPIPYSDVVRAVQITSRYPAMHGSPIHIGDPIAIGIRDINNPDFGDSVPVYDDEVPVFWACGVTPQSVAIELGLELMITHAPGHMFITDMLHQDYSLL